MVAAGWYYSPQLRVARANWALASAGIITAGGVPNPTFGFSPTYAAKSPGTSPWVLGFDFNIPIETAGRREHRITAARARARAALYRLGQTAWQVRFNIRKAWIHYGFARQRMILIRRSAKLAGQNARLLAARFRAGQISRPIFTAAQMLHQQQMLAAVSQAGQIRLRRSQLAASMALPAQALHNLPMHWSTDRMPAPATLPLARLQRWALFNRMDIQESLAAYAAANADLKLQIARQYPNINLGPGYSFDQGENKFTLGLSMTLPIFNQNQGPIAQAQAQRVLVAQRFESLQTRVLGQTAVAMAGYRAAWNRLHAAARLVRLQMQEVAVAAAALRAGSTSRLGLIEAQQSLVALELSQLGALEQAQLTLGSLQSELQRPLVLRRTPLRRDQLLRQLIHTKARSR